MQLTRRRALKITTMSAAAVAMAPVALAAPVKSGKDVRFANRNLLPYGQFSVATFEPWIGSEFNVTEPSNGAASLTLVSVNDLSLTTQTTPAPVSRGRARVFEPRRSNSPAIWGFSLQFSGSGARLRQDTYTLNNSGFGSFSVFLVPSSQSSATATYTAIFAFVS